MLNTLNAISVPKMKNICNALFLSECCSFRNFKRFMGIARNNESDLSNRKPNLPKHLFWDWDYDAIDWEAGYRSIIARVLERGNGEEWNELIRFYGEDTIINALKKEIKYLPDYIIGKICDHFHLDYVEMACYTQKQSRKGHWI